MLKEQWNPVFNELLNFKSNYNTKVYPGGRCSGKTVHCVLALLDIGEKNTTSVLCTREYMTSIRKSVHKEFKKQIDLFKLTNWKVTEYSIKNIKNGSEIIFMGMQDPDSIQGVSKIDICWVEEAHGISMKSWMTLDNTIREKNSMLWITYNPKTEHDAVTVRYVDNPSPRTYVRKVNWDENIFFNETMKQKRDNDYAVDYDSAYSEWEGFPEKRSQARIIKNWEVKDFDYSMLKDVIYYHGVDWGAVHPATIVQCFIYDVPKSTDKILYVTKEAGGSQIDLGKPMEEMFDSVLPNRKWRIIADNAAPECVSFMKNMGFRIESCVKGPGSVEDGIKYLRSFKKIVVHSRCKKLIDNLEKYSYKVNPKTDEILEIVVKENDDYVDALRYSLNKVMRVRKARKNNTFLIG